jgi:branched-chain amino acid transport system permease protein
VAAGLQLVFGVQRIFNLACGSFYALGAYTGVSAVNGLLRLGLPRELFPVALIGAGVCLALIGPLIEWLLRFVYERDEALQLLLTFALVLMCEDIMRLIWGPSPLSTGSLYLIYGQVTARGVTVPVYNLIVIAAGLVIALLMGTMLASTRFGRIIRATAENREMSAALGVNLRAVYVKVFTLGTLLGTLGGALVIPATATMSEMGIELIVEAFAVVVIGGLGSMRGALVGALVVGILQAVAISTYPELEMVLIYLIVIAVLVLRPQGLFGEPAA